MKISISILCFNESKNLNVLIKQSKRLLNKYKDLQIIFVDNGSSDQTSKILSKISKIKNMKCVFVKKNIGYGYGIIQGLKNSDGDIIGWTHGDDLNFYNKILAILNLKFDNKNFFLKGYRKGNRPLLDTFFSYSFNTISSILLLRNLWEITAHPTLFSKKLFFKYKNYLPYDFSIDLFLFFLAKKNKYQIKRLKFDYDKRKHGASSWNKNIFSKFKLSGIYLLQIFKLIYLNIFKI